MCEFLDNLDPIRALNGSWSLDPVSVLFTISSRSHWRSTENTILDCRANRWIILGGSLLAGILIFGGLMNCYFSLVAPQNIFQAAKMGDLASVQRFLSVCPSLLNTRESTGGVKGYGQRDELTPLDVAIVYDRLNVVAYLLHNGASTQVDGGSLQLALAYGHPDIAESLLRSGIREDFLAAAGLGDLSFMRRRIKSDHGLLTKSGRWGPPILMALDASNEASVRWLVKRGVRLDARVRGFPLLFFPAFRHPNLQMVRLLLSLGANPNPRLYPDSHQRLLDLLKGNPFYNTGHGAGVEGTLRAKIYRLLMRKSAN